MVAIADGIDLDALLAPIVPDSPAGTDPRQNFDPGSLYFRLRDARAEARAAERQADAAGEEDAAPRAHWAPVVQLATTLLTTEAKDLEVASWCTEALLRTNGLAGFTAGCELMSGLIENFWDDLYPRPEEEGMADRVAPIAGLNGESAEGTLIQPLRKLPLFPRSDGNYIALWQYQQSLAVAGMGDRERREQRIAAGNVIPFEQIEADAAATPASVFARLLQDALAAVTAWRELSDALDARAGRDAPSTSRVRDLLDEIVAIARRFAPTEPHIQEERAIDSGEVSAPRPPDAPVFEQPRGIATREDALRVLDEVAAFFRRTEPHSPIAYTLYEAVRRGRLTWPELLEEIVPDQDIRDAILRSLGIRPPAPPE
jgi:type VI secretion system protein ImpA